MWQPGWKGALEENGWLSPFTVHLKPSQPCLSALLQYEIKPLKLFKQWSTDNVTKKLTGRRISKTLWKERQWHKSHKWQALAETKVIRPPLHADDSIPLVLIEVFNFKCIYSGRQFIQVLRCCLNVHRLISTWQFIACKEISDFTFPWKLLNQLLSGGGKKKKRV